MLAIQHRMWNTAVQYLTEPTDNIHEAVVATHLKRTMAHLLLLSPSTDEAEVREYVCSRLSLFADLTNGLIDGMLRGSPTVPELTNRTPLGQFISDKNVLHWCVARTLTEQNELPQHLAITRMTILSAKLSELADHIEDAVRNAV